MSIKGVNPQPVIDDNGVAGKKQLLSQGHAPTLCSMNGSAGHGREIHAAMRRAGLSVQNAALAEIASSSHAIQRNTKVAVPESLGRDLVEDGAQFVALFVRALDLLGTRLYKFFPNLQSLRGELPGANGNLERTACQLATGRL